MKNNFAKIVSGIFHPLLIPTYGLIIYLIYGQFMELIPITYKVILLITTVCFTIIIPAASIGILSKIGTISSINLFKREERRIPMIIACLAFAIGTFILGKFNAPPILLLFLKSATLSIALVGIISLRWKISAHLTAMGGITAAILLTAIYSYTNAANLLAISFIVSGLVGYSRLKLNAHTPAQTYSGFFLGFMITLILFAISI